MRTWTFAELASGWRTTTRPFASVIDVVATATLMGKESETAGDRAPPPPPPTHASAGASANTGPAALARPLTAADNTAQPTFATALGFSRFTLKMRRGFSLPLRCAG